MMQHLLYTVLLVAPGLVWGAVEQSQTEQSRTEQSQTAVAPVLADPVGTGQLLQVAGVLILVLASIVALAWLLRRFGNFSASGNSAIRTLAGISLGQRERVVLIEVGETQLLLGVAPGRVETLHVLAQPVKLNKTAPGERFAERLAAALKKGGAAQ